MSEQAISTPDDDAILAAFAAEAEDVTGLLAYALHRKARIAFREAFKVTHGRAPDPAEWRGFLAGEVAGARIAAYRAEAERLMEGTGGAAPRKPARRWPLFGLFPEAMTTPPPDGKVNWRGLILRLLMLLGAVMLTAILLRILVVPK